MSNWGWIGKIVIMAREAAAIAKFGSDPENIECSMCSVGGLAAEDDRLGRKKCELVF